MSEEGGGKTRGAADAAAEQPLRPPHNYYYGTFQGVANYQPQPPPPNYSVIGFPQPVPPPPPAFSGAPPHYYPQGYQTVPGYAVAQVRPFREDRLPCCGVGLGWFFSDVQNVCNGVTADYEAALSTVGRFISGFFLGAVPWYIGAFVLLCVRMDYREKPGLIACAIGAMLAAFAVTLGVTRVAHSW